MTHFLHVYPVVQELLYNVPTVVRINMPELLFAVGSARE